MVEEVKLKRVSPKRKTKLSSLTVDQLLTLKADLVRQLTDVRVELEKAAEALKEVNRVLGTPSMEPYYNSSMNGGISFNPPQPVPQGMSSPYTPGLGYMSQGGILADETISTYIDPYEVDTSKEIASLKEGIDEVLNDMRTGDL